jgi:uncharacterized protein YjbI with pentapeptide repeats
MANTEHLDILRQGVEVWNKWREENPDLKPDLGRASLVGVNLSGVDFSWTNLRNAKLQKINLGGADLSGANLSFAQLLKANLNRINTNQPKERMKSVKTRLRWANLNGTQFEWANLSEANLSNAYLDEAALKGANLSDANLTSANLVGANLAETTLKRADFSHAQIGWSNFGSVDLSAVKGLQIVKHIGPSSIGIDTIIRSAGKVPEVFWRQAGVPRSIIEQVLGLVGSLNPIDYYSCFMSYSSKDQDFAERLYADLQNHGVRCWFAPEDMMIGDKFWYRINESIRLYDKLMVVLSARSVQSDWVEREVMAALEKEKQGSTVLFPIALDDAVKDCTAPWAADIRRSRHIGDFRSWKNYDDYQRAFARLLRDLKASS